MKENRLHAGVRVEGPFLPEPIEIIAVIEMGSSIKLIGKGLKSGLAHDPILAPDQVAALKVSAEREPFDADSRLFRLGVEAHRLGLALHPEDPNTAIAVRFIEVKGRAGVGEVAVTTNEHRSAERLKDDYWLYVVFGCSSTPKLYTIRNPAKLGWQPVTAIEHFRLASGEIEQAASNQHRTAPPGRHHGSDTSKGEYLK